MLSRNIRLMKPEEIRAQISSLNDELKDTLKEVNIRHSERDLLLKQIDELSAERRREEDTLQKVKDSQAGIRSSHESQLDFIKDQIDAKSTELEIATQKIQSLEIKESQLIEKIKSYREDKKKLAVVRKELEEAEKNRPLIEAVKKELLETIDKLEEAKVDLDVAVREAERTKNTSKEERAEHVEWVAKTKQEAKQRVEDSTNLRIEWETKLKDLKIVEKRLKKVWPSDVPFPKIHDAGVKSGN